MDMLILTGTKKADAAPKKATINEYNSTLNRAIPCTDKKRQSEKLQEENGKTNGSP